MTSTVKPERPGRRAWFGRAGGIVAIAAGGPRLARAALPALEVFRSPTCGCCGAWIEHMEAAGFEVRVRMVEDTAPARSRLGLAARYGSCHTAVIDGYVVEGHVPAAEVRKLLSRRPEAIGLTVPGMPIGSPGMEMGERREPYDVLLVGRDGKATVFASYR